MDKFYWLVGAMIVMNLGTIVTIVYAAGRAVWWMAKLDSRVTSNSRDLKAAHDKLRELREFPRQL
jgi:hypothetical protein